MKLFRHSVAAPTAFPLTARAHRSARMRHVHRLQALLAAARSAEAQAGAPGSTLPPSPGGNPPAENPGHTRSGSSRAIAAVTALTAPVLLLSACADKADEDSKQSIRVTATDSTCSLSSTDARTGSAEFVVTNEGTKETEFYVLTQTDGILGEVESIGPGASRTLVVELREPGTYVGLCRPGMVGDGVRTEFTATGESKDSTKNDPALAEAVTSYKAYVREQAALLQRRNSEFVAAIEAGDLEKAKSLFAYARTPYERIEPVAEAFPNDLDPRIDLREADLENGATWTGYHRIEKDLWVAGAITAGTKAAAAQLAKDVGELVAAVNADTFDISPVQIASGAQGLLDEVATSKITGEEDIFSHTDLSDFQANVEGSRAAVDTLRKAVDARKPGMMAELDRRFDAIEQELAKYRRGQGFVSYDTVGEPGRRELSQRLDNLTEQVARVQGVVA